MAAHLTPPPVNSWLRALLRFRALLVWALITAFVILVMLSRWAHIHIAVLVPLVLVSGGGAVAVVLAVVTRYLRARHSRMLWISAAAVMVSLTAVAIVFHVTSWQSHIRWIAIVGAIALAWCLSLERVFHPGSPDAVARSVFVVVAAAIEFSIACSSWWFLLPWVRDLTVYGSYMVAWFAQGAVLFVVTGVVLTLTSIVTRWPFVTSAWPAREVLTLTVSVIALVVSLVGFAFPLMSQAVRNRLTTQSYLQDLTADSGFWARAAATLAEPRSPAEGYAKRILWTLDSSDTPANEGAIHPNGSFLGEFEYCLPALQTFSARCGYISNVLFSSSGRIMDFQIDGVPVASLFEENKISSPDWQTVSVGADKVAIAHIANIGGAVDHIRWTTFVFSMTNSDSDNVRIESASFKDMSGNPRDIEWLPLPSVSSMETGHWAFKSSAGSGILTLCLEDARDKARGCSTYPVFA